MLSADACLWTCGVPLKKSDAYSRTEWAASVLSAASSCTLPREMQVMVLLVRRSSSIRSGVCSPTSKALMAPHGKRQTTCIRETSPGITDRSQETAANMGQKACQHGGVKGGFIFWAYKSGVGVGWRGLNSYLQIETWLRGPVPTYRANQTQRQKKYDDPKQVRLLCF
jgi:hypothetical protein